MNVTAVLVTRGDVDIQPVLDSLPAGWRFAVRVEEPGGNSVYGRYAALQRVPDGLIYVQDDDVIVSDPQAIVDAWVARGDPDALVANMPAEFRPHYPDSCLVGFGAAFHRDLPARAFERFEQTVPTLGLANYGWSMPGSERFNRTCDVVFTTLTPRVLVDVPKTDRLFASDQNRMWRQPDHHGERMQMLELARQVRDA